MRIRGVLFDMDGVLLNTERVGRSLFLDYCAELGYPQADEALYSRMLGLTYEGDCALLREALGPDFPCEQALRVFRERLGAYIASGAPIAKPYVAECVAGLKARGIRIALATSTARPLTESYIAHVPAMRNAFDFMVCGTEAGRGKPAPDIFLKAAQGLGLDPETCLGVEDSLPGLKSLTAAGCVRVMCPDLLPFDERFAGVVDHRIDHLGQLCGVIDRINLPARPR